MTFARDVAIVWLVGWGAAFSAISCLGLLRMPDLYSRLHAASKAASLGTALLALALIVHFADASVGFRAVALGLMVFITAPLSAHLIARAAFVTHTPLADEYVVNEAHVNEAPGAGAPGADAPGVRPAPDPVQLPDFPGGGAH